MSEEIKTKRKTLRRSAHLAESTEARVAAVEMDSVPPAAAEPVPLMLTQEELFKLRLYEADARHAKAEAETCRVRKKWILALLDPKGTVTKEEERMDKWSATSRDNFKKYENAKSHISMRLRIDLNQCGFDTETGLVVPPEPSAKGKK